MTKNSLQIDFALQGGGSHGAFAWGVSIPVCRENRQNYK